MGDTDARARPGAVMRVGILTISNPIYWGTCEDECAPLVGDWVRGHLPDARVELVALAQQRRNVVQATLMVWADEVGLDLVFTIGGVHLAPDDVAVQAADAIVERLGCDVPGVAGWRGHTLIVNLPDDPEAIQAALSHLSYSVLTQQAAHITHEEAP